MKLRRYDAKARVDERCDKCGRIIPAGRWFAVLLEWDGIIVDVKTGQQAMEDIEFELIADPHPRAVFVKMGKRIKEGRYALRSPPSIKKLHLHGCGVDSSRLGHRLPGSFGTGKRQ